MAGHEVVGLARSETSAARLAEQGYRTIFGELGDGPGVAEAARSVDAVIHAASPNDETAQALDETASRAIVGALRGTSKRFIYTSGCLLYGPTGDTPATEHSPLHPVDAVRYRQALEAEILSAAGNGVHSIVIRPSWVYGHRAGTAMMMYASAKDHGAARYVGSGLNRWTTVHADDLADLYLLALEHAPTASIFNGSHGEAFQLVEIAKAASMGAGARGEVSEWLLDEARQSLWSFADAIACDQVISSDLARSELGWHPHRRSIVDELRSYAQTGAQHADAQSHPLDPRGRT